MMKLSFESFVSLKGPCGKLGALVDQNWLASPSSHLWVMLHPLTSGGGEMNNKVVTSLVREANEIGLSSCRFNMRGAGTGEEQSEGSYLDTLAELEDLEALLAGLLGSLDANQLSGLKLHLGGFSFGALVAASYASLGLFPGRYQDQIASLTLVAPPTHLARQDRVFPSQFSGSYPVWVGCPLADEIVPVEAMLDYAKQLQTLYPDRVAVEHFPLCSHFFHGQLPLLRSSWQAFIKPHLS